MFEIDIHSHRIYTSDSHSIPTFLKISEYINQPNRYLVQSYLIGTQWTVHVYDQQTLESQLFRHTAMNTVSGSPCSHSIISDYF